MDYEDFTKHMTGSHLPKFTRALKSKVRIYLTGTSEDTMDTIEVPGNEFEILGEILQVEPTTSSLFQFFRITHKHSTVDIQTKNNK